VAYTGAAGVMIGRAAQGRPWLCGQVAAYLDRGVAPPAPDLLQQWQLVREHVQALHDFYGDFMGVRIARKHVGWYLQGAADFTRQRKAFNRLDDAADQLNYIDRIYTTIDNEELAA
jgi:tRNA-dihydrouridine synthase B